MLGHNSLSGRWFAAFLFLLASSCALFFAQAATAAPGPGVTFIHPVEASTVANSANDAMLEFTNEVDVARQSCRLDDAPYGHCFEVLSYQSSMSNGVHRYFVRTVDSDGDVHIDVLSFTVDDATAPVFSVAAVDGSPIADRPRFEITLDDLFATVVAEIDGVGSERFVAFGGVHTWTPESIPNGTYDINFRMYDPAMNSAVETLSVTVDDQTAPTIDITSPVAGSTQPLGNFDATFTSDDPGARFTCRIDQATPQYCSPDNAFPIDALRPGSHQFSVAATDSVGNSSSVTHSFTVDSAPVAGLTVVAPADGATITAQPLLDVESTVPFVDGSLRCSVDGGAFLPCSEGQPIDAIDANGSYELAVSARTETDTKLLAAVAFTVNDTTPPTVATDPGPVEVTDVDSFSLPGSVGDEYADGSPSSAVTVLCSVDDAAATDCLSSLLGPLIGLPATLTPNVTHSLELTASDWVGNSATDTTTIDVTDETGPIVEIISPADGAVISGGGVTIDYEVSGSEWFSDTSRCQLDSNPSVLCAASELAGIGSWTTTGLTPGPHTVRVSRSDIAGNEGFDEVTFTVSDATGPGIEFMSPSAMASLTDRVNTSWVAFEKVARVRCAVDSEPLAVDPVQCDTYADTRRSGFFRPTTLAAGERDLTVEVTDVHGNASTATLTIDVADVTAPEVRFDHSSFDNGFPRVSAPTEISFSSNDLAARFTCSVDGGTAVSCGVGRSSQTLPTLAGGPHTFAVTATDPSGNATTRTLSFIVHDLISPVLSISGVSDGMSVGASLTVDVESDDDATVTCALDSGAYSACGQDFVFNFATSGSHTLRFRAIDASDNQTDQSFTVNATIPAPPAPGPGPGTPPPPSAPALVNAAPKLGKFFVRSSKRNVTIRYSATVGLPAGVDLAAACVGKARVVARVGKKTVAKSSASLKVVKGKCTIAGTLKAKSKGVAGKKFKVTITFAGNAKVYPFGITGGGSAGKPRP